MFHHIYRFRREDFYKSNSIYIELIGDVITAFDYCLDKHSHDKIEFCLVSSGRGYFSLNDIDYNVKAGDIFISLPGQEHCAKADPSDPFRFYYLMFGIVQDSPFKNIYNELLSISRNVAVDNYDMNHSFKMAIYELMANMPDRETMLESIFNQIIVLLHRNFCISYRDFQVKINSRFELVQKVISYLDANTHKKIDLYTLSIDIGYNYSYISRIFKEQVGISLSNYCTQEKLKKAKFLLEGNETISITETACKVGFEDIHYFSKLYKKYFGFSPSKYKNTLKP